ncbi:tRNA 2'-phosphotransferase 1-like [Palaemon carinicauda]|uniref:tRNA 2'-phosphotransferase 1-like n=1 Tax=Palaemon carinicauda TaxID=392227 RepID=UPI0035B593C5
MPSVIQNFDPAVGYVAAKLLVTVEKVREIVANCPKQRFKLEEREVELYIRANQGHSLQVEDLELEEITSDDGTPVIHGTYRKYWESIRKEGLRRMTRNHVHFTSKTPEEVAGGSGIRSSCQIDINVDLAEALQGEREGRKTFRLPRRTFITSLLPVKIEEAKHPLLLCGDHDSRIRVFTRESLCDYFPEAVLNGHEDWVTSLDIMREDNGGLLLASGPKDSSVCVWKVSVLEKGDDVKDAEDREDKVLRLRSIVFRVKPLLRRQGRDDICVARYYLSWS